MSQNPFGDAPFNPYQAPTALAPQMHFASNPFEAGVWRQGDLLVMHKTARLPDRCLKTNEPTLTRFRQKLFWHHPAIYLLILVHVIIYVILANVLGHRATVEIGVVPERISWRRKVIAIAWLGILGSIAAFIGSFQFDPDAATGIFLTLLLGGIFGALAFAIFGVVCSPIVRAKRIDHHYIWMKGVCPAYLNLLPEFPYPPR